MNANRFSVASHFVAKDEVVRTIYERLLTATRGFGPVKQDPKKTSIHLVNRTAFVGVVTRKHALVLTVKSERKLSGRRIRKSQQTSPHRVHHEIRLTSPADVDAELTKWLQAAYELSA